MFLNIPLLRMGYTAIVVSVIVGLAFMVFPVFPAWIGAIVCLLVTGIFIIACVNACTVANVVSEINEKIKTKTAFIRMAVVETENIMARATTTEIKTEVEKVYDALRYSDPMSNPALDEAEKKIDNNLRRLEKAVTSNDSVSTLNTVAELLLAIKERNSKCKLLK